MSTQTNTLKKLMVATTAAFLLASCASTVSPPMGAAAARSKLMQLQSEPELASRATVEIRDAELAVAAAETPERDQVLGTHLVLLADQKIDIARYWAQSRLYEDQREALSKASEQARLDSRTLEATRAREEADRARNETNNARAAANSARNDAADAVEIANQARNAANSAQMEAEAARRATDAAIAETDALQLQIAALNARETDRGLVVTLGDVLFETGKYEIQGGNTSNLDKLAVFLNRYSDRTVSIEGHTDDVGDAQFNLGLSQNRANAVKDFLVSSGIDASRLSASGRGENSPIASNDNPTGRQQNRRVEVIIANSHMTSQ